MDKKFYDVFPTLKLKKELGSLMEMVRVTKVSSNTSRTNLRVYITSERWIHGKYIRELENQISRQFFAGMTMDVKVVEKFNLSGQYTPENFFDIYRDSMEFELQNYNNVLYSQFHGADYSFPSANHLVMTIPDTIFAGKIKEELTKYLEKVFCIRCGMDLSVEIELKEPEESRERRNAEKMAEDEAQEIVRRAHFAKNDGSAAESGSSKEDESLEEAASRDTAVSGEEGSAAGTSGSAGAGISLTDPGSEKKMAGSSGSGKSSAVRSAASKSGLQENGKKAAAKKDYSSGTFTSDDPDILYGRDITGDTVSIDSIAGEMEEVVIRGQILDVETRELRNQKTLLIFPVTDFTDSIMVKMFLKSEQAPEVTARIKKNIFVKIRGTTVLDRFDGELTLGSIKGIRLIPDFTEKRKDHSPEKRVELHCHTKMSDMDGVTDAKALVKRAYEWGHKAIAITDHGVVQAFPEANHCFDKRGGCVPKDSDFKVLYGMEAYLVDDLKGMVTNDKGQSLDDPFVVFDI